MKDKKTTPATGEEVQVIKKKPRGKNIGETLAPVVEPGDNTRYLNQSIELMNLPSIDLRNEEEVEERLNEFFGIMAKYDTKPTVAGMALSLGISRQMLWAIRNDQPWNGRGYIGDLPPRVSDAIKKAYLLMENLWENYMQNGKINPVSGIFLGKNNFGYQDKTEYVVTPNVHQDNYDPDSIRQRYLIDSAGSGSDSDSDGE